MQQMGRGRYKESESVNRRAMPPVWSEVVARVQAEKAKLAASPPPPPTLPVAEEKIETEEATPEAPLEEQIEWNKKAIEAGRYLKERRVVWGVDRHIYHKIPQPLDRCKDRHVDRRISRKRTHLIRRPIDRRIHRGAGRIRGVNPFRRGE